MRKSSRRITQKRDVELKAGLIYKNIARCYFEEWYPDMSKHLVDDILVRSDIEEIEAYVRVRDSLEVAVALLKSILKKDKIRLARDAFEVLLYSETPEYELEETIIEVRLRNYSLADKVAMNNALLSAVHDNWVSSNSEKFFYMTRVDKLFMFMPYELIGIKEVFKDYIFIKDLMSLMELNVEDKELEAGYYDMRASFLEKNGISTRDELVRFIMKADYNPLEIDITAKLRTDYGMASEIADQIIDKM